MALSKQADASHVARSWRSWLAVGRKGRGTGLLVGCGEARCGIRETRWDRDALYASKTLAPPKQGPARLEVEVPGSSRPGLRPHDKDQGDSSISLLTNTATEDNALTLANLLI